MHNSKEALFSQKGSGISFEHGVLKVKKCILHPITSQRQTRMVCLDNVRLENLCLKMLIHACVWLIRKTLRMVFLNCILMMEEFVLHDLRPWYIFRTSSFLPRRYTTLSLIMARALVAFVTSLPVTPSRHFYTLKK